MQQPFSWKQINDDLLQLMASPMDTPGLFKEFIEKIRLQRGWLIDSRPSRNMSFKEIQFGLYAKVVLMLSEQMKVPPTLEDIKLMDEITQLMAKVTKKLAELEIQSN